MKLDVPFALDPLPTVSPWVRVEPGGLALWIDYDHPGVRAALLYPREDGPGVGLQLIFAGNATARWEWDGAGRFLHVQWWGPNNAPPCPCPKCQEKRTRQLEAALGALLTEAAVPRAQFRLVVARA